MKRIVMFVMSTITAVVLLLGYHTSTSSKAAGGQTAFVATADPGSAGSTAGSIAAVGTPDGTSAISVPSTSPASGTTSSGTTSSGTTSQATTAPATTAPATTSPATTAPVTTSPATAASSSAGKSGTVTGTVADTRWGPVQVELTLQNGRITNVSVVQYPNNNGRDQEINSYALPILVQETISAQSAKIDTVSGATVTSDGYLTSLQNALDQAGL